MTEPTKPINADPSDDRKADETFAWTTEPQPRASTRESSGSTTTSLFDTVRDVVDELAERAAPAVRELSARAAELTAVAADRAVPLVKRAAEATADASGKLAARSREWASDLRSPVGPPDTPSDSVVDEAPPPGVAANEVASGDGDATATGVPGQADRGPN